MEEQLLIGSSLWIVLQGLALWLLQGLWRKAAFVSAALMGLLLRLPCWAPWRQSGWSSLCPFAFSGLRRCGLCVSSRGWRRDEAAARKLLARLVKARRLGELLVVAFGSPDYFARHGPAEHSDDLAGHDCVLREARDTGETWTFRVATHAAVASGLGIGLTPCGKYDERCGLRM